MTDKKWTKEMIKDLIMKNNVMVERSLLILLARQTQDEQAFGEARTPNGMGFSKVHANFLTSLAKQVETNRYNKVIGSRLSRKQLSYARKYLIKYANQLANYANYQQEIKIQRALGTSDKIDGKTFQKGGTFTDKEIY